MVLRAAGREPILKLEIALIGLDSKEVIIEVLISKDQITIDIVTAIHDFIHDFPKRSNIENGLFCSAIIRLMVAETSISRL